ncbi:DoxX family protein [Leptothoe sp. PORK10 BA2]|uniref:DoxX family protein n=1 Tax=Leptothoe sp. PORK10 BA2 TaxID=3110254 RepID=UPI002B220529|nr:DoxX family protein [Leptothoe sp. PORK10 BA2]MEA5466177.1 DoxX family protein [Leptothoe sp. PORK10 BA2]
MALKSLSILLLKPNVNLNLLAQATLAIVRVTVSIMMVHNGFDKLADIEGFAAAYVEYLGLPFPIFLSYVAAYTELIGAPLVAFGLLTRPAALGLFSTMAVAMYHHIKVAGLSLPYLELSAIYAAIFLFFAANGAGLFSVDALLTYWLNKGVLSAKAKQLMKLEESFEASSVDQVTVNS